MEGVLRTLRGGHEMAAQATREGPIPVYLSRHTPNLPDGYGAKIKWKTGERVKSVSGLTGVVHNGELSWHDDAPEIDSARGWGQWVIEIMPDDNASPCAVSAARLLLP
jgi:hypothetical protein